LLAALDEVSPLIEFLGDKDAVYGDVRNTAMYGLRNWLARNGKHGQAELARRIQQHRRFAPVNASLVVSLLSPFSAPDCKDPATYQRLIGYLDHDKLEVRHLAAQHLYGEMRQRMPEEALKIDYLPTDEPHERQKAVAKWQKIIPAGNVPPVRRVGKSGG
jgi:hypothetical protein